MTAKKLTKSRTIAVAVVWMILLIAWMVGRYFVEGSYPTWLEFAMLGGPITMLVMRLFTSEAVEIPKIPWEPPTPRYP